MKRLLFVGTVCAALLGCSDPYDLVIPASLEDKEFIEAIKDLPIEDRTDLGDYYIRVVGTAAMGKFGELMGLGPAPAGIPPGTTVREALDAQRKWKAEQQVIAEQAKALEEQQQKELEAMEGQIEDWQRLINISSTDVKNISTYTRENTCSVSAVVTPGFTGSKIEYEFSFEGGGECPSEIKKSGYANPVENVSVGISSVYEKCACEGLSRVGVRVVTAK